MQQSQTRYRWIGARVDAETFDTFALAASAAGLSRSAAVREALGSFCDAVARSDERAGPGGSDPDLDEPSDDRGAM